MAEGQKDVDGTPAGRISPGKQKSDGGATPASANVGRGRKPSMPNASGAATSKKGRMALSRLASGVQAMVGAAAGG